MRTTSGKPSQEDTARGFRGMSILGEGPSVKDCLDKLKPGYFNLIVDEVGAFRSLALVKALEEKKAGKTDTIIVTDRNPKEIEEILCGPGPSKRKYFITNLDLWRNRGSPSLPVHYSVLSPSNLEALNYYIEEARDKSLKRGRDVIIFFQDITHLIRHSSFERVVSHIDALRDHALFTERPEVFILLAFDNNVLDAGEFAVLRNRTYDGNQVISFVSQ